jgi:iron complex outermembrane receptor protein
LSDIFTVRAGFARMGYERTDFYTNNQINAGNTSYNVIVLPFAPRDIDTYSGQAFLDAKFHTGPVKHRFTVGFDSGNYNEQRHQNQSAVITLGTATDFSNPTYLSSPTYTVGTKPLVEFSQTLDTNVLISDSIDFSKSWSAVVGVDNAGVIQKNYSLATTLLTADYEKRKWTPTASLIYKPVSQVSTYFTYIEGLQQGGTAPSTAANPGVQLPPDVTRQYEFGAKATLGKALLTAAFFDINEAFDYVDPTDNVFKSAGREDHKGVEIGITGRVVGHLNLYGGLTLLDPKIQRSTAKNRSASLTRC